MSEPAQPSAGRVSPLSRWRGWIIVAVLLAGMIATTVLLRSSPDRIVERGHLAAWRADAAHVLKTYHFSGCVGASQLGVHQLPGVGAIATICVSRSWGSAATVTFTPTSGADGVINAPGGVVTPPACARALGAGWWQLARGGSAGSGCPGGFMRLP